MPLAFILLWTGKWYVSFFSDFVSLISHALKGIPLFHSTSVLYSADLEDCPPFPHDHVDDIESFFWIFTYIVYTYDSKGVYHGMDRMLRKWEKLTGTPASDNKGLFLLEREFVPDTITPRWPKALLDVYSGFGMFLAPIFQKRMNTRYKEPDEVFESLKKMASSADKHYDDVLQIFDNGIEALEEAENEEVALKELHRGPVTSFAQSRSQQNPLKRGRGEEAH